ncbi:hypothetical protein [Candidatus Nitrososphaera sp. FF02]|uniref:hypothetical protein n=1 Tax=Candidatus Nitrososphaera sp. FF02 TaxID=3398226 RepID=UPI0039E7B7BC
MTAQATYDKLLAEIAKNEDHKYFDILAKNEKSIDWLAFAARIYRKSHSTNTITSYCKGIVEFRSMVMQGTYASLGSAIEQVKGQTNGLAYKMLDDFVTWCDASRQFRPRTTRNSFLAVVSLFGFLEIELNDSKLDNIRKSLPTPKDLRDEYPPNSEIRAIDSAASLTIKGYRQVINDTGFEPVDAAQLQVKDLRFNEEPVRINKDREKTGKLLEGFLSAETVETLTQIIRVENKGQNDYLFATNFTGHTLKNLREAYNLAVARAGFGEIIKDTRKGSTRYRARVKKIDGHVFGKYHLKVYKKRWFTIAVTVVPVYVAQAMLGRGAYLDEYYIQPLEKRQEFGRKILKAVSTLTVKADKADIVASVAETLGIDSSTLSDEKLSKLREAFSMAGHFLRMPNDKLQLVSKILKEANAQ